MDPAWARDVAIFLLILWATTGLTIVHLGVLAWRFVSRHFARKRPREAPDTGAVDFAACPTITFVVPVFNDALTVGATIESILRQTMPVDRVLVIDDGSTDGTPAVLENYRSRGVTIVRLATNGGKTRALDAALAHVDTDLVAITDADSVVDENYVQEITRDFADPDLAAVGGAVESIPHTWVTAARQIDYMLTVHIDRDAESTMKALVVLPGVSSTYRASTLREMGFEFDTIAEDFDMTFRMQRARKKIKMNMRAKVFTSDPPTLRAYYRQLVRWYTDFWLVLRKHRAVLGKRVFGTVEVPLLVLNATVASAFYLVLPLWFAWHDRSRLPLYFATSFAMDLIMVTIAWRAYHRRDLWWALASRTPTRVLARFAYLLAMTRVLIGRPGRAWAKLERRSNDAFLYATARRARTGGTTRALLPNR
ncbi:MAG: glycosyltransferase [Candidatus Thermoplasmatota archaeon]